MSDLIPNPVVWFEIFVRDMKRSVDFYETVLQTTLQPHGEGQEEEYFFSGNDIQYGIGGALVKAQEALSKNETVVVYFSTKDCGITAEKACAHGGTLVKSKHAIGQYGFVAVVTDLEGNRIGLHSLV